MKPLLWAFIILLFFTLVGLGIYMLFEPLGDALKLSPIHAKELLENVRT